MHNINRRGVFRNNFSTNYFACKVGIRFTAIQSRCRCANAKSACAQQQENYKLSSISFTIRDKPYSSFHPQSFLATASSMLCGQLLAMFCRESGL